MKRILYLSLLCFLFFTACTYNNEEDYYASGNQSDTLVVIKDVSLIADFQFESTLIDSSSNDLKLNFEGTPLFNTSGYKPFSKGSLELDGNSSFSFFTGVYDTISICFHMKSTKQLTFLTEGNNTPTLIDYGRGAMKFEVDGISGQTFITLTSGVDKISFEKEEMIIDTWAEWNFVFAEITKGKVTLSYINPAYGKMEFESAEKAITFSNGNLVIGKSSSEPNNYFKGSIDDLKVFKRGLSEAEINSLK